MKNLTVFLFLTACSVFAQKLEIGAMVGVYNYKGEFNRFPNPINSRGGGGVFVRQNITHTSTFRYSLNFGSIHGSDALSSQPMNVRRNQNFSNSILEGSAIYEYNFLNFRENEKTFKRSSNWAPYLCGGIGFFVSNSLLKSQPNGGVCLPIGMGVKYKLGKKLNLGADILARKTFLDGIDGQNNRDLTIPQTTFETDRDWYYSACFIVSYTFYKIKCPEYTW